jgi:hypothetical protein
MKKPEFSYLTELKKTLKNYAIPIIATGVVYLTQNCNNEAILVSGLTLGGALAYTQNTLLKRYSGDYKI